MTETVLEDVLGPLLDPPGCCGQAGIVVRLNPQQASSMRDDGGAVAELAYRCLRLVFGDEVSKYIHCRTVEPGNDEPDSDKTNSCIFPVPGFGDSASMLRVKYPDPKDIASSFFATRHEAVVSWGYGSSSPFVRSASDTSQVLLPIAVDRPNGSTAKRYQCIPRGHIASFVRSIAMPLQRNVYALVDDNNPCDPFFDVDGNLDGLPMDAVRLLFAKTRCNIGDVAEQLETPLTPHEVLEVVLASCLTFLTSALDQYFVQSRTGPPYCGATFAPQQTVVLTASSCEKGKISFHIHMRWAASIAQNGEEGGGDSALTHPCAFRSIMELKHFSSVVQAQLQKMRTTSSSLDEHSSSQETSQQAEEECAIATVLQSVLDLSVYSRWRPLRLPYNVKSVDLANIVHHVHEGTNNRAKRARGDAAVSCDTPADADQPRLSQVLTVSHAAAIALQTHAFIGASSSVCVGCRDNVPGSCTLLHHLRPLLPLSFTPDNKDRRFGAFLHSALQHASCLPLPVEQCEVDQFALDCFDMACVTRPLLPPSTHAPFVNRGPPMPLGYSSDAPHDLARSAEDISTNSAEALAAPAVVSYDDDTGPSLMPMASGSVAPFPSGRRHTVNTPAMRQVMWRLFQCLHPTAFQNLRPDHLNVVYEDAAQRYWYVYQKHNRYCLHLNRQHKQTHGQLYLTYGSIKFRCYSNDCCRAPCWRCSWGTVKGGDSDAPGRASTDVVMVDLQGSGIDDVLREIHAKLFPELDAQQLRLRFPSQLIERDVTREA